MLAGIRDGFADRGIGVRVLFSMRDPVARLRSHLRMDQQKGRLPATDEAAAPSRYDLTLDAIEQVFAPKDCHVCLFEELFTPEGIARFAAFAGVPADPAAGDRQVNARGSDADALPEELATEIARHYRPVYEAAAARLPQV